MYLEVLLMNGIDDVFIILSLSPSHLVKCTQVTLVSGQWGSQAGAHWGTCPSN